MPDQAEMGEMASRNASTLCVRARPDQVTRLIREAQHHPFGTDFLVNGSLDAVAATFQAHAFVVDAAREALRSGDAPVVETMAAAAAPSA